MELFQSTKFLLISITYGRSATMFNTDSEKKFDIRSCLVFSNEYWKPYVEAVLLATMPLSVENAVLTVPLISDWLTLERAFSVSSVFSMFGSTLSSDMDAIHQVPLDGLPEQTPA